MERAQRLCNALIHSERSAQIAGARVFKTENVKRRLKLTVFTLAAVKREEGDVSRAADFNNVFAKEAGAFVGA